MHCISKLGTYYYILTIQKITFFAEGTSTHDEGYAATNKPPGKPLEEAFVDDTKVEKY